MNVDVEHDGERWVFSHAGEHCVIRQYETESAFKEFRIPMEVLETFIEAIFIPDDLVR